MKTYVIGALICSLSAVSTTIGKELFRAAEPVETRTKIELTPTAIPVDPGAKYQVAFMGRTSSEYTIEANARIRIMYHRYIADRLRMQFYDETGAACSFSDIFVITQDFTNYVRVFYPPAEARSFKLHLQPAAAAELAVKEVVISTDLSGREAECLNPHPTFDHGDLNTYGCTSGYGGRFYTRPDGKTVWNTGFCGYSPAFPVQENTFYNFYCRGTKYRDRKSYLVLECYNAQDPKAFKNMRIAFSEDGENTELKMPAGTVSIKLLCYSVIIEEFKVTERLE